MNRWFESATGLTLLDPAFLVLALLVPLALWIAARRAPASIVAPFVAGDGGLPRSWRVRLLAVPAALTAAGLLAAVFALARPVQRDRLPIETAGIDLLLCLDTSSSMRAEDLGDGRTRLAVAKDAGARFVAGRPHDRVGLVTFARYPDVRCPPTLDHDAFRKILADVAPVESDGPEDATGIGTAVARAAQALRAAPTASKVVILLTDGAENVATASAPGEIAPAHAAQLCRELGVRVYAIAAGAAPDADTRPVAALAERTGGRLFQAPDAASIDAVYTAIDALETTALAEPKYRTVDRFAPFVAAAVVLVALGTLLRATVLDVLP